MDLARASAAAAVLLVAGPFDAARGQTFPPAFIEIAMRDGSMSKINWAAPPYLVVDDETVVITLANGNKMKLPRASILMVCADKCPQPLPQEVAADVVVREDGTSSKGRVTVKGDDSGLCDIVQDGKTTASCARFKSIRYIQFAGR